MLLFLVTIFVFGSVTVFAARMVVRRWPALARRAQVWRAALVAPCLCILLFVIATAVTLIDARRIAEPGGSAGMVVFAMVFFLFYGLVLSAIVGIPTAIVAVRRFRTAD